MTENFWIYDIPQLFNTERLMELWPYQYLSIERKYNAITRLILGLTILGYFFTKSFNIIVSSIIVILVFIILYHVQSKKEGFDGSEKLKGSDFKNIMKDNYTFPTKKNPLMNVMMDDYKYNNKRKPAAPSYNESIARNINSSAQEPELLNTLTDHQKLYRDLGDNLTFEHTMRNFHTMPNTKIPNDQRKFADFCYGNMASCKDGDDVQCSKNMRRLGNAMF
tara:strand:- start:1657 stop:2319 length:663 start_codon:yes stop_codon:yes gene_type:complete